MREMGLPDLPASQGPTSTSRDRLRAQLYQGYVSSGQTGEQASGGSSAAVRAPHLRALIRRHFPADRMARVLDIGCGHGALLLVARTEGYQRLAGIDASLEQVQLANRLGLDCVKHGDLMSELRAQPAESCEVIVAFDVLEHLEPGEAMSCLGEARRILSPDGRIILHVPNGESPFVGAILYGDFTHERAFTRRSLTQLCRAIGFSRIECHEDQPVVHGVISASRWALWRMIRLLLRFITAVETGDAGRDAILTRNMTAILHR